MGNPWGRAARETGLLGLSILWIWLAILPSRIVIAFSEFLFFEGPDPSPQSYQKSYVQSYGNPKISPMDCMPSVLLHIDLIPDIKIPVLCQIEFQYPTPACTDDDQNYISATTYWKAACGKCSHAQTASFHSSLSHGGPNPMTILVWIGFRSSVSRYV